MDEQVLPVRSVTFKEAIVLFFSQYATFSGRATRKEYWYAILFTMIVAAVLGAIPSYEKLPIIGILRAIFAWGTLIPTWAVAVRRLHDAGKSGWNMLFHLIPLLGSVMVLLLLCRGSEEDNDYGPKKVAQP